MKCLRQRRTNEHREDYPERKLSRFRKKKKGRICHSHRKLPSRVHGRNGVLFPLLCDHQQYRSHSAQFAGQFPGAFAPGITLPAHYIYSKQSVFHGTVEGEKMLVMSSHRTLKATVELSLVRGKSGRKCIGQN